MNIWELTNHNYIKNKSKYVLAAYTVALAAPGVGGRTKSAFRLGSVIVDKNRILTARYNELKTHPKLQAFSNWPFLHAESSAILSLGMDNCAYLDLYVIRIRRDLSIAPSKPCDACLSLIKKVGIKRVYYSTDISIEEIRV